MSWTPRPAVFLFLREPRRDVLSEGAAMEGVVLLDEIAGIVPWENGSVICLRNSSQQIYADEPPTELIKRWLAALIEHHPDPQPIPRVE